MRSPTFDATVFLALLVSGSAQDDSSPVYLNHTEAYGMLSNNSQTAAFHDFYATQRGCDAQVNQFYCAAASTACLLNSFAGETQDIRIPVTPEYDPYPYAVDVNLLEPPDTDDSEAIQRCIAETVVIIEEDFNGVLSYPYGMVLGQVANLVRCYINHGEGDDSNSLRVRAVHVDETVSVDAVREDLKRALEDEKSRVLTNFHRSTIGQPGGGHWSPIVGYEAGTDSFLVQDVAKYKFPPFFASAERLHASMQTLDGCGDYDFPRAQVNVANYTEALDVIGGADREVAVRELGCQPAHRGYIIVEKVWAPILDNEARVKVTQLAHGGLRRRFV